MGFKLPEIEESKPIELKLGKYTLPFRKYKVRDFTRLSSDPFFRKMQQTPETAITYMLAFLLDVEDPEVDTMEQRLRFIESIDLESMYDLFDIAKVLGVDDSLIKTVQKKIAKNLKQTPKGSISPTLSRKQGGK